MTFGISGNGRIRTLDEARTRWPGQQLFQCSKCGHTAAGIGQPQAMGGIVHYGCGGEVKPVPGTLS